jgi:hypothetical protein
MNKKNKIFGIITLLVSIIWLLFYLKTYYDYNYTSKLFFVMVPNWILVINIIAGIIGSIVSIGILKQKINPLISTIIIFNTYLFLFGLECYSSH